MAILTSPSRTLAQPQMVPFKLFITELWQLDDDQDPLVGLIGDFYARVTINGVEHRNDDSGDGACDDESSLGIVVPLQLFKNFTKIPQCSKRTPWDFSQLVPAGEPVHVHIQIFDADLALDDELDLKLADGNAISFDVDPATGKWSGDVNYPQNCSRPGLNLGGDNANVCWQASFDTDDDGLLDVWERSGVDTDNDSLIDLDLPALGVNPLRKDIFVEADYLTASNHSHGPSKDAIQRVVASFANAPIANPDNTTGVQLHVDVGSLYGAGAVFQVVGTGGVAGSYGDFGGGNAIEEAGNEIIEILWTRAGAGHPVRGSGGRQLQSQSRALLPICHLRPSDQHSRRSERLHHWRSRSSCNATCSSRWEASTSPACPASRPKPVSRWDRLPNRRGRSCTTWVTCWRSLIMAARTSSTGSQTI